MTIELKTNAGTRIGSMVLDHIAMTFIAMIFFIPGMVSRFSTAFEVTHEQSNIDIFGGLSYVGLIGLAIYFCKDCINGRSIGKRALKLQVVENLSGNVASPIRCFIRDIFCVIWPIEVIVTLANPSRRIGDMVAGTKVVPFDPELEQPKSNFGQIGLALILAYGIMFLLMLPFESLKSKLKSNQVTYIESSLNEQTANETEQIFKDSLSEHLTSDVLIYDQIEQNKDLKYVSVILRLKENYLENDDNYEQIKSATVPLLLTKFPEGTFVGQIKYIYQQPRSIHTRTLSLDWRKKE
ncbi:putative RDD family membrane protein YckC [Aquimarina sp. MAR_2010_214]|uniref:RDD family protein n=1 Tax=Aquimarina sp. MAR_2010_214 TaxID=1250026 RepID=UPI000C70180B|nr:RDD family protein [Aquimarina sp. MAR_2010_214]PKV49702.1 putative RDD family membrane protein YckC [Aquimarina sp. MAR_2010_214]